jgi:general secretion pathway protein J
VGEAGLTLLELLVAIGLLGLLFVVLQGGFALGHRVWERAGNRLAARIDTVTATQTLLRERIARANPAYIRSTGGRVTFEGYRDRLVFDAPPPDAMGPGTYLRYTLAVSPDGELELSWKPDTMAAPTVAGERIGLLAGVAGLDLAYFGRGAEDAQGRWSDVWRNRPRAPEVVRVRVLFAPGDGRVWPDLMIAPRATVDAQCVWSPTLRACEGRT